MIRADVSVSVRVCVCEPFLSHSPVGIKLLQASQLLINDLYQS